MKIFKKNKIALSALGSLLALEILFRILFPPTYHPFGHPISFSSFSPHHLSKLVEFIGKPKPKNEFRVLVTGGSAAVGVGASDEKYSFPSQLERELNEKYPGRNIKVFNAGVGSFNASKELMLYIKYLWKLNPDYVLMFTGYNDLGHAVNHQLNPNPYEKLLNLEGVNFISRSDTGGLFKAFVRSLLFKTHQLMLKLSRIYRVAANVLFHLDTEPRKSSVFHVWSKTLEESETFTNSIAAFFSLASNNGSQFSIVLQPIRSCVKRNRNLVPNSWMDARIRDLYEEKIEPTLRTLSESNRFQFIDLNKDLSDRLVEIKSFVDAVHLNDNGYRIAAEVVSEKLNIQFP